MDKILTFGELCEAVRDNKTLQWLDRGVWTDCTLLDGNRLSTIVYHYNKYRYRIKPELVFKYQWIIKEPDGKYFLTTHKETEKDARYHYGDMIVEPYLPSKEPV